MKQRMSDELVSALLPESNLRVVVATTGALCRHARSLGELLSTSAELLGQALTAGALIGSLQKEKSRINIQLECDGPLRGLFVDGDNQGSVRGYVKNHQVEFSGAAGEFRWRPALGNSGYLSVLRDLGGGEYYRSSVQLEHFDFARDMENYFHVSEQIRTRLVLASAPEGREPLGGVAGALVQPLPDGDLEAFEAVGKELQGRLSPCLAAHLHDGATAMLKALLPERPFEVMSRYPLSFSCSCSKERVLRALVAMGRAELEDMLHKDGKAEVSCQFCTTQYVITDGEIRELLASAAG
jgi:molecular chaperone Hsp33